MLPHDFIDSLEIFISRSIKYNTKRGLRKEEPLIMIAMNQLLNHSKLLYNYSFTAPAEMLLMIYFEQKQNTIRIGMMDTATAR